MTRFPPTVSIAILFQLLVACGDASEDSSAETEQDTDQVCDETDCGPAPGMPNYICEDGMTEAGPTGECEIQDSDDCGWTIVRCPEEE